MSRQRTGTITVRTLSDGTRAFQLRFNAKGHCERVTLHERRGCKCGCGGGWTRRTAQVELKNIVTRVEAGVWQRPSQAKPQVKPMPTFHEYASAWLDAKLAGSIGDRPIEVNAQNDYRWRLTKHLLPYFASYRLDEIDADACQAFKAKKLADATEMRAALAAGAQMSHNSALRSANVPVRGRRLTRRGANGERGPRNFTRGCAARGRPRCVTESHAVGKTICLQPRELHRRMRGPRALRSGASAVARREPPPMQARWCYQRNSWLISTTFPSGSVV